MVPKLFLLRLLLPVMECVWAPTAREQSRGQARGCGRRGRGQELVTKPQPRAEPWLWLGQSGLGGTPSLLLCGGWPVAPPRPGCCSIPPWEGAPCSLGRLI